MDYFYDSIPPPEYQPVAWIVDVATLAQGLGWTINYGAAIYQSIKDQTYGMAIFPLCCNFSWELLYTVGYASQNQFERIIMTTWLILNSIMMVCAVRYAPNEWGHAPLVRSALPFIFLAATMGFIVAQLALTATVGPGLAMNWVGCLCYLLLSVGSLCQLMTRASSRGTSYTMWLSRVLGTYVGVIPVYVRSQYWPEAFSWVDAPIMKFCSVTSLVVEICYVLVLQHIRKQEHRQMENDLTEKDR